MSSENVDLNSKADIDSHKGLGIWIRRLISVLAFGVVLYLFWPLIGELKDVVGLIKTAGWTWLGLALLVQFVSYLFLTELNRLLLSPFEGRIGFWRLMAVLPAMAFIEVAIPSAGLSGVVLRARLLKKSGYSVEASSFTLLIETVYIAGVMVVVSFAGIWYLVHRGGIRPAQLAELIVLGIFLVGVGIPLYKIGSNRQRGSMWVEHLGNQWNRILSTMGHSPISIEDLKWRTELFYDGFYHLQVIYPALLLGLAIGRVFLDVATLGICFIAFHYVVLPGILLTGYGLMLVLSGLAALPGGLGLVDVSLAVIFSRLGAPGAVAVAAALCYRLIAFWLIRFAGFISWQVLETRDDRRNWKEL